MKLKKQFNHLRIGKGLLCLLALFMMLLAPQGAWAAASVYTTSTLTVVQNEDFNCTWTIDEWHAFNVYSNSTTSDPSVSVSDQSLVVTAAGCTIRGLKGSSAPSDFWNIVYKVEILGNFSDNSKISVKLDMDYGDDHNFIASTVPGEFYLPNSVEWNWQDELCIEIGKACTITGIRVYYSTASNTASYGWADEPKDNNNQDISGAKQTDGSIKINYNEHHSYKYPFAVSGANYNSTDETVATIDTDGTVTIKKTGSTTITATIHNQNDYANDDLIFGYTLTVTEEEVSYGLSVAGVDVTSGNADNVLGDELENHMVTFNAENNTLTLNNATINPTGERYGVYYTGTSDFTIKLIGTNSITTGNGCEPIIFNAYQPTTIPTLTFESGSSPCSLALNGGNNTVIKYFGSVQGINGLGTTTTGNLCLIADEQAQYIANTGLYKGETTSSGAVTSATITSGYGLKVAGVWVHDGNKDNVLGDQEETHKVTFTPAVAAEGDNPATPATLTLNNANFNGTINWTEPSDLKVEILGSNTIDVSYSSFFTGNENANLILATNASNPGQLKLTTCSHGNEVSGWKNNDIIYNTDRTDIIAADFDWWADFSVSDQSLLMFNKKYDLWVDNVRLCSAQSEIVYGQTNVSNVISFDGNYTLTFNNVTANSSNNPFIKNGLSSLEINLVGENSVSCGQLFLDKKTGDDDHNVTFKTNSNAAGTLVVTTTGDEDDPWYEGHDTPTVKDLIFTDEMKNSVRTLTFSAPTPYDLSVAGVRVTNANATEITDDGDYFTGTATYNNETHTLTLNNVAIDLTDEENEGPGIKYWGTANLTIVLNGTNSILVQSGCEPIIYDAAELPETVPTLTFVRGSHPCSLELFGSNSPVIKNFGNVLGVNGINGATGNFLKLDSEDAMAYSQADGLHIGQGSEMSPVTSAHIVSFLLDPKFSFSDSENSGISTGGTKYYNYGQEYTMPVLKRWDDGYQTDLSGFSITYTSSDENVATISNTGAITIVGGGWAEIKAVSQETDVYAADSTWFTMEVKPADPNVSLEEGAYFTGQKLTLTRVGLNGSMYYSYGEKTVSERTAYDGEISLPAGTYDFYPFTRCGTDEQNIWSSGNAHRMLYVYNQPTISKDAGEYEGDIEVEITNLPQGVSVYYYFDDDKENEKSYTAGDKIAVRESTKLNVYLLVEGDSNKKYKTPVMERQYVIKDIPLAVTDGDFHNHWMTYYNANGNVALSEGIGAYIATEVGASTVTVTQINSIPRGVPVLLNNETTTTTENTTVTGNKLLHADKAIDTSTGDAVYYGLYNGMMKRIYGTIPEGKNYLMLSIAIAPQNAPQLNIVIGNDGNTTGISQTESRESEVENVYDLQGRKIQKPSKNGMYIKNGRKVLINNNNRY